MRKFTILSAVAVLMAIAITACGDDSQKTIWNEYADWRNTNQAWLAQQEARLNPDGTPYYQKIVPVTNHGVYILKHRFGQSHPDNLQPLFTSTVTVNYQVHFYNDTLLDEGAGFISTLSDASLIDGWSMAITTMNVGDSAEFLLPYEIAYGISGSGNVPPFSALRFNIGLTDVNNYQTRP